MPEPLPDDLEGRVNRLQSQIDATVRVFKRILDLSEDDPFDRAFLLGIRDAIAYAVTMKGREQDTEKKLRWVEARMTAEVEQKSRNNSYVRMLLGAVVALIVAGITGLVEMHWK